MEGAQVAQHQVADEWQVRALEARVKKDQLEFEKQNDGYNKKIKAEQWALDNEKWAVDKVHQMDFDFMKKVRIRGQKKPQQAKAPAFSPRSCG